MDSIANCIMATEVATLIPWVSLTASASAMPFHRLSNGECAFGAALGLVRLSLWVWTLRTIYHITRGLLSHIPH